MVRVFGDEGVGVGVVGSRSERLSVWVDSVSGFGSMLRRVIKI